MATNIEKMFEQIEKMFEQQTTSIQTINHNSDKTVEAINRIAICSEKLTDKVNNIENDVIKQTQSLIDLKEILIKKILFPVILTICGIAGGVAVLKLVGGLV